MTTTSQALKSEDFCYMRSNLLGYVNVRNYIVPENFPSHWKSIINTVLLFVQGSRVLSRTMLKISKVRKFTETVGHSLLAVCLQKTCFGR